MLLSFDLGLTLANMAGFQRAVKRMEQELERQKASEDHYIEAMTDKRQNWQERLQKVPAEWRELKETLPKLNFQQRRLLKNFPQLKVENITNLQELKSFIEELRKK